MTETFMTAEYFQAMGKQAAKADPDFYETKKAAINRALSVYHQRKLKDFKESFISGYIQNVRGADTWEN